MYHGVIGGSHAVWAKMETLLMFRAWLILLPSVEGAPTEFWDTQYKVSLFQATKHRMSKLKRLKTGSLATLMFTVIHYSNCVAQNMQRSLPRGYHGVWFSANSFVLPNYCRPTLQRLCHSKVHKSRHQLSFEFFTYSKMAASSKLW